MIVSKRYDGSRAVEYARRWALGRNPLFYDFSGGGGNCTNFVSQCLLAGSLVMNPTPTFGWYYTSIDDRAPSWTGVGELYDFLVGARDFPSISERIGPFCNEVEREAARPGDVIQLANENGIFYHSLLITGFSQTGDILICANSKDSLDRPLSTYTYAAARFLHVSGVNVELLDNDAYFDTLLSGTALLPKDILYFPTAII